MVMVCCQRGRRGDVQNTYCLESNIPLCRVNARLGTLLYVSVLVFLSKNIIFVRTIFKPIQLWKIITMKHLSWRFWRLQLSKASQHQPLIMKRGGSCKTYLNV